MTTPTHQPWLCAYCILVYPEGSKEAQTPAVTLVEATAVCADHTRGLLDVGRMRHD